jgi:hypothetical protein
MPGPLPTALSLEWMGRLHHLELRQMAGICAYYAPEYTTPDGELIVALSGWRDLPLDEWGEVCVTGAGVVALSHWYPRRRGR